MASETVRKQIEFYLCDANLARDSFFRTLMQENKEGFVPLEAFTKCKLVQAITTDEKKIAEALDASDILALNEDKTMVKRSTPVDFDALKNYKPNSVFVRPVPSNASVNSIKTQFSQFGNVIYVELSRRGLDKRYCHVEFESADAVAKVLEKYPAVDTAVAEQTHCNMNEMHVMDHEAYTALLNKMQTAYVPKPGHTMLIRFIAGDRKRKSNVSNPDEEAVRASLKEFDVVVDDVAFRKSAALVTLSDSEDWKKVLTAKNAGKQLASHSFSVALLPPFEEAWMRKKLTLEQAAAAKEGESPKKPKTDQ